MEDIEKRILELFTFDENLKFSEIESIINIRSNKLAYHLKNLVNKKILEKVKEHYRLTETAENIIPYLSEKNSPLVVVLVRIGNNRKCFLAPRGKRPFKGKLSLPGGRLLVNETIGEAVKRIMKEKYNIDARLKKVNSVSFEIVKKNKNRKHSFLLILATATTKSNLELIDARKNKKNIISSDYKLITSKDKELEIKEFITPA